MPPKHGLLIGHSEAVIGNANDAAVFKASFLRLTAHAGALTSRVSPRKLTMLKNRDRRRLLTHAISGEQSVPNNLGDPIRRHPIRLVLPNASSHLHVSNAVIHFCSPGYPFKFSRSRSQFVTDRYGFIPFVPSRALFDLLVRGCRTPMPAPPKAAADRAR